MTDVQTAPPRFDEASADVLTYLRQAIPIGTWTVTRFDGERQIYLSVDDTDLGLSSGDSVAWSDSMCQYSVTRTRPTFVDNPHAVARYAAIIEKSGLDVESYVGYPLTTSDGKLFGTLCGFGRHRLPETAESNEDLIVLLASLLARILEADLQATAVARALEAARRNADTDALTGLVSRSGWQRLLEDEEARFRRFGDPGAVVIIDLDDLKEVNDLQGHHAGDDHLRSIATILTDVVVEPGIIARIGGDEFAILLTDATATIVDDVVARLRRAITTRHVSASMGFGLYSITEGLDGAWRAADAAMYIDKMSKRPFRENTGDRAAVVD
ncbi:sensor domain-containing diguanylate cyclase [Williamsia phyllosphaerae]|uniref:Histidine kinase n=1 Tax=Williamsia phyllosphaerae TaxID=885042 RepID=A0ABQ1V8V4_9NOCA|nr:sensor domain-containing diguanylate cyclase [Williamsia phyllosphaerae]GGF42989.1 histidine kinase [Williamsia phyllosphaerae]